MIYVGTTAQSIHHQYIRWPSPRVQDTWKCSIVTCKFIDSPHLTVKLNRYFVSRESWRARYFFTSSIWVRNSQHRRWQVWTTDHSIRQSIYYFSLPLLGGGERMTSTSTRTISLLSSKTSNAVERRGCSNLSYYSHPGPSINKRSIGIARASSSFSDASVPDYLSSDW